jgi:hypothetical protein
MTIRKEVTQFSRFEYLAEKDGLFDKYARGAQSFDATKMSARDRAMFQFAHESVAIAAMKKRVDDAGGLANISRIRVFAGENENFDFEFSLVKPIAMVLQERKKDEAKARRKASEPKVQKRKDPETKADPKRKQSAQRRAFLLSAEGKTAAFEAALKQRRDRARFSKKETPMPVVEKVKRLPTVQVAA